MSRGEFKGKWYAEVFESVRWVGIETISVHEFDTEKEKDKFINDYNQILLTHKGIVPVTYRMASEPTSIVIGEFLKGKWNDQTSSIT